jgi:hypothetical protein
MISTGAFGVVPLMAGLVFLVAGLMSAGTGLTFLVGGLAGLRVGLLADAAWLARMGRRQSSSRDSCMARDGSYCGL